MSYADQVFKATCRDILENGVSDEGINVRPHWPDGTPAHTIKKFGVVNRYDLSKEFPIVTIRRTYWKSAIDELLWIWQKKSNRVAELGSRVWDEWVDENGTIGKAYGYQVGQKYVHHVVKNVESMECFQEDLSDYPSAEVILEKGNALVLLDQTDAVIYDLRNNPASRRIIAHTYNFKDLHEMGLYPCAYSMTFNVTDNKLNAILNQRSQDMAAASAWNVLQYSVLAHMMAQVAGLEAGELVHVIADCHIYDRHIPIVKELIEKEELPAPEFVMDKSITNFYDFTKDSFQMKGYQYQPFDHEIPIAI
jgi:thymidylate synthase